MSKSLLIIGSSSGIGYSSLKKFLSEGYRVFALYHDRKNKGKMEKLKTNYGDYFNYEIFDLEENNINKTIIYLIELLRTWNDFDLDSIILNSGISKNALLGEHLDQEIDDIFNVNILNQIKLVKGVLPLLLKSKSNYKNIVGVSSIWGHKGAANESVYAASKGAMDTFLKSLAKELAFENIRVNIVSPGLVDTGMLSDYSDYDLEYIINQIPSRRFARIDEISELIYSIMNDFNYMTGNNIVIDGGYTL